MTFKVWNSIFVRAFLVFILVAGSLGVMPAQARNMPLASNSILVGDTVRVSVDSNGGQGVGGASQQPTISADGRYVAFKSYAPNLVLGDTNGQDDIFLRDLQAGTITRVSVDSNGVQANNGSDAPYISADGRYIVFASPATNLVLNDTNGKKDIFAHHVQTGATTLISVDSSSVQANGFSYEPSISADGRYVAFESDATNLVPGDTNGVRDVFVHDLQTGVTARVSVDSSGGQANNLSSSAAISSDGHYITFSSSATNLVLGDMNAATDVFVRDLQNGQTARVSVDSNGAQAINGNSVNPSISADGRYVAFESYATNLVAGDTNAAGDIFLNDRQLGITTRVSVTSDNLQANNGSIYPSISGDGRTISFSSAGTNLVPSDTNGAIDVFVHIVQTGETTRVSVDSSGIQANDRSDSPSISADGQYISFQSYATNLTSGDTNGLPDVFVHRQYVPSLIRYVNQNGSGANNGSSWADAFSDLQQALAVASNGDEIWVAAGTYKPTAGTDRSISFVLKNNVSLYGGFAGNETYRAQRDPVANVTVLSGDLGLQGNNTDNSYHVVVGSNTDNTAALDGFTITAGNANQTQTDTGGGMLNYHGSPTVANVTITKNSAGRGGGMYNGGDSGIPTSDSNPLLNNVKFIGNSALDGGGMENQYYSSPILTDVHFSNNTAVRSGGGMLNMEYSAANLTNVTFNGNTASAGGAMANYLSNSTLTNVTFSSNSVGGGYGGGIYNTGNPILTNVTFYSNTGFEGGGFYNYGGSPNLTQVTFLNNQVDPSGQGGGMSSTGGNPSLTNVTFTGNSAGNGGGLLFGDGSPTLTDVTFNNNTATSVGGGMYNGGLGTFTNITFNGNIARDGGGLYNSYPGNRNPSLTNITFIGNSAEHGGAIYNSGGPLLTNVTLSNNTASVVAGGILNTVGSPSLYNSILWGNTGPDGTQIYNDGSSPTLSDSVVQGGCPVGSICTNVMATDPLLGMIGNYGGNTQTIPLLSGSSAIDHGDLSTCPASDQRGVTRPQGSSCDSGAYEYVFPMTQTTTPTNTATLTPTATKTVTPIYTPTATKTSTPTYTPTPTLDPSSLFQPYVVYPGGSGQNARGVGIGDFNHDGLGDVAIGIVGQILVYLQKNDGSLANAVSYATYDAGGSPIALVAGDINNDHLDDVIAVDGYAISVYLQKLDGTLASRVSYPTDYYPDAIAIGDVNNDGRNDIAVSHWSAPNIGIFLQNANGSLNPMIRYASPEAGYDDIAIGDVNNDGRNDVVKMNGQLYANPNIQVYLQTVNGTLASAVPYSLGCQCLGHGIGIGDVTGDGRADVVMSYGGNRPTSQMAVFAQGANGTLQLPVSYAAYDIPEPVEVTDVNADGRADILSAHGGWAKLSVYLQQLGGTLSGYTLYPIANASHFYPQGLTVGDINQDGLPDVAIADVNNGLVVLYHNPLLPTPTPTNTPTSAPTFTPTITPTATNTFTPTATPPYSYRPLYLSLASGQILGGVSAADEDILKFDGQNWSLFFDGSDAGLGSTDLFAFAMLDPDSLLMSFTTSVTVNGITATPQDVLRFDATSLGSTTAGTWSMYFDGSDVGFDTSGESIDALALLPDGRLLFSTTGSASVTGVSGADEDILAFAPTSLGDTTAGTWSMYFDGSDVGLADSSNEDVDAADVTSNGNIYLSTVGDFSVNGVSGADEDVFVCAPTSIGNTTACTYSPTLYFDGSTWGLASNDVDAFNYPLDTTVTATPSVTATSTFTATATSTATNTPTRTPTPTATATRTNTPIVTSTPTNTATPTNVSTQAATVTATSAPTNTSTAAPTSTATFTSTATNTATATNTSTPASTGNDLIFADDFESGSFSAWSASAINSGNLSVTSNARLAGNYGLQATISNTTAMYVRDDSPNAEPRYRARFYFHPNSITMASGNYIYLLQGHDTTNQVILFVQFYRSSTGYYQLRARAYDTTQANYVNTPFVTITNAMHAVEVDWGNDGHLNFWVDGVQQGSLTGINNSSYKMDSVRFGAPYMSASGTSGSYYLDGFESRRQTYIGP